MTLAEQLETMTAEAGLGAADLEALTGVLSPLDELADAAPTPSPELAALLGTTVPLPGPSGRPAGARSRRSSRSHGVRRTAAGALVLALSGVGATGLSAAANTLPEPWQHRVSEFSHDHLPFEFPEPSSRTRGLPEEERDGGSVELPRTSAPSDAPARRAPQRAGTQTGTQTTTQTSAPGRSDLPAPVRPTRATQGRTQPGTAGAEQSAVPGEPGAAEPGGGTGPSTDTPAKPVKPADPGKPTKPGKPEKTGAPAANTQAEPGKDEQGRGPRPREQQRSRG